MHPCQCHQHQSPEANTATATAPTNLPPATHTKKLHTMFPLPAAVPHPHSPVRRQFGHEFYISPERAAHPLSEALPHPHSPVRVQFGHEFYISPERAAHPLSEALPHPHSPVRRQFGHEFYISPEQAAHPLSTAAVPHPHSPVRRQFGNEFYISPARPAPAAHLDLKKDHPPSTATVATETEVTPQTYAVNKVSLFFCFMYITLMPCVKSDLTSPV